MFRPMELSLQHVRALGVAFAILASSSLPVLAQTAPPMTFEVMPVGNPAQCGSQCPRGVLARGEIVSDTPEKFLQFIRAIGVRDPRMRAVIFIDSPGGLVVSSMRLGHMFRAMGAAAVVPRECASACVYALMGATRRVVPPQSRIVLHRMFAFERFGGTDGAPASLQRTYSNKQLEAQLSQYARRMGVSADVIRSAESIRPEGIKVASQAELRRWRLSVPNL